MEENKVKGHTEKNIENTGDINSVSETKSETKSKIIKKLNWSKVWIVIFIIVFVALAVVLILIIQNRGTGQEMLNVTYNMKMENGTTLDSGIKTFALESAASAFGFKTNKIDEEIETMQEGEEKTITLEPKDAYGEYDDSKIFSFNRTKFTRIATGLQQKMNRTETINRTFETRISEFTEAFNTQPILNQIYSISGNPIIYKVINVGIDKVRVSMEMKVGDVFPSSLINFGLTTKVTKVTDDKITLMIDGNNKIIPSEVGDLSVNLDENYVYFIFTPVLGKEFEIMGYPKARTIEVTEDKVVLDSNPKLAGEKIIVNLTLNNKYKEKVAAATGSCINIPGAPTMQVFIMSYCPYGLQMLKGMLPVWENFQDKANIELRFVSYTMHGQKEEDENYRMVCIREEQCDKLIPYLKCFATDGDYSKCLKQVGIDESKLNSCMTERVTDYFEEDKALNEQFGVSGSPTTVIDNKVTEIWPRSPENIKQKLCNAFTTKPSECSETLDTANPSPGFGLGTSSQSGSC